MGPGGASASSSAGEGGASAGGRDPDAGAGTSAGENREISGLGLTCGPLLTRPAVHYPEPSYKVERAYPALQALGAPAVTSPTLPSQEKYLGVWCVNQPDPRHGHGVVFG